MTVLGILVIFVFAVVAGVAGYWLGRRSNARELQYERELHQAQSQMWESQHKLMSDRFENLASQILEKNSQKFTDVNGKVLQSVLEPLRQRLRDFEKKVDDVYGQEARERFALQKEIGRLMEANMQISQEASNLTRALKGDVKAQGTWGEVILEKILESSGLREGEEFSRQGKDMDLKDDDGRVLRPDIIIHLPDSKHVIIDSKVSLVAYEKFVNCVNESDKQQLVKQHVDSVIAHVKNLSDKHYQALEQLHSPDFVLLFMPVEGALSLALHTKIELFQMAWEHKVVLVSPTTLLATLKTVASIWRYEKQNKHVMEIARQGGALYDDFVRFLEDLNDIGKNLKDTQQSFESAVKRLSTGKGNLIGRVEKLRELGAKAKKDLKSESLEELPAPEL